MKKRIFSSIFLVALLSALVMGVVVLLVQYGIDEKRIYDELRSECGYVSAGLACAADEEAFLAALPGENRMTLIEADGAVAFDNGAAAAALGNHLDRPEIREALISGSGKSMRYSDTQLIQNLYYAARLPDGRVLRLSAARKTVLGMLDALATPVFLILLCIATGSLLLSRALARRIVTPLNALDLDRPLTNDAYDEIAPLLTRLEGQRREIAFQMSLLTAKQREFASVTERMREGLLLLDRDDRVLTVNKSAARMLGIDPAHANGAYLLSVTREEAIGTALEKARETGAGEASLLRDGRYYQLLASAVRAEDGACGTVLLLLDVTDRHAAEESRRAFTANVSHELKTPLTSISGYAELLRDGVAKPADTQRFAGKIFDESHRLLLLIDDILRLSRLDEKTRLPEKEPVDLFALCEEVAARLAEKAERAGVTVTVAGVPETVGGIPKLLDEMVYNLMENAVKYNVADGSVAVRVSEEDGKPALTISDTGIGIPKDEQERVFERFYRVDKSRSKATGGTGLGLSIVKHGAELHGATITLESEPGKGTRVKLLFP